MAHPFDEMLQQQTDETTDSAWSAGDQLNLNKTSDKGNSINNKQKEDANMDGGPEETDITDGDTTYADITDAEGNCDNGQEEDTG